METGTVPLESELTLFEYDTCSKADQASALYGHRQCLEPYVKKCYLTPAFMNNSPYLRASHFVGLFPFSAADHTHLLLIAPKGCRQNERLGLLRFLELLAVAEGATLPEDIDDGWNGQLGAHRFLLFLASYYARLLQELCRRDFRSYYRPEAEELRSRIRGRLHLSEYASLRLQGKPHVLPCRWEEFTVDNWDNRILWAAARRLKDIARAIDSESPAIVWKPFEGLSSWFSAVSEVPIRTDDFRKSRLGRTSRYYRQALAWARLLLQGSDLPKAGGQVPPLIFDTHKAFEKFAEAVALAAVPEGWQKPSFQQEAVVLTGQQIQTHCPDILLLDSRRMMGGVGDAKYKEVLEGTPNHELETGKSVLTRIQSADWNQLYVYMRTKEASRGFFVVPFWNADGPHIEWLDQFNFTIPACNTNDRIAVLALNLLRPLKDVKKKAAEQLRKWLLE